jgi:hypothetical protein
LDSGGGNVWLIGLRTYPLLLLLYSGGIAATGAGRYDALFTILQTRLRHADRSQRLPTVVSSQLERAIGAFKLLPGLERNYTPLSDRLASVIEPLVSEVLFLGGEYDALFDRFEVFQAIEECHQTDGSSTSGRFSWRYSPDPLASVIEEARATDERWPPVAAGFCGGSIERFRSVAETLHQNVSRRRPW